MNKKLNEEYISIKECLVNFNCFLKNKNEIDLKIEKAIINSLTVLSNLKINYLKFDFKASQFYEKNNQIICIDPIIFK